jgi:hypothetical protein
MLYGENSEALRLIEDCLKYYMYIGNMKAVERLTELKKSIINIKRAK